MGTHTSRRLIIIVIAVAAVTGIISAVYLYNKKPMDLSKADPDYIMTSAEMISAFMADEESSVEKYVNSIIEVTGPVYDIGYGNADSTLSITLKNEGDHAGVICTFKGMQNKQQVQRKRGDVIRVRGICSGMLMDILLNDCVLLKD